MLKLTPAMAHLQWHTSNRLMDVMAMSVTSPPPRQVSARAPLSGPLPTPRSSRSRHCAAPGAIA